MNIIQIIHWLLMAFPTLYVLLKGSPMFYDFVLIFIIMVTVHWVFLKGECILGYLYKKQQDCDYKLGDISISTDVSAYNNIPKIILQILTVFTGLYITHRLNYNSLLYIFIIISTIIVKNKHIPALAFSSTILAIYFLKDNKYLISCLIALLGSTFIVHHKEQNSCIVGTQVKEEEPESMPL